MTRQYRRHSEKTVPPPKHYKRLMVNDDLYHTLKVRAARCDLTISQYIHRVLTEYVRQMEQYEAVRALNGKTGGVDNEQ